MSKIVYCINDYDNITSMVVASETIDFYKKDVEKTKNLSPMCGLNFWYLGTQMRKTNAMDFNSAKKEAVSERQKSIISYKEEIERLQNEIASIETLEEPTIK